MANDQDYLDLGLACGEVCQALDGGLNGRLLDDLSQSDPGIPPLWMEAAYNIFHGIYGDGRRSSVINGLLKRLGFHALSITLLATPSPKVSTGKTWTGFFPPSPTERTSLTNSVFSPRHI